MTTLTAKNLFKSSLAEQVNVVVNALEYSGCTQFESGWDTKLIKTNNFCSFLQVNVRMLNRL
jgi:hypothetical protein